MINRTNIHSVLRTLGLIGLFLVLISQSSRFENPVVAIEYIPYAIILSLALLCTGLYFKIKFAEEGTSILTHLTTIITLIFALIIGSYFLYVLFLTV